ncbi:protein FAM8A1-like [Xiphias gladius]|uniref:protein FAM8A1-like n=1 Tax=Xiphias gladius TaxID=8245 RepID=UPI001A996E2C|nr:protein FAM8A1-like [Xiphias gladius]
MFTLQSLCLRPYEMVPRDVARDAAPSLNMADQENTNMEGDRGKNKRFADKVEPLEDEFTQRTGNQNNFGDKKGAGECRATSEYCEKLQAWMWQYYTGYVNWQSWLAASAMSFPHYLQSASGTSTGSLDFNSQHWHNSPFGLPLSPYPSAAASPSSRVGEPAGGAAVPGQPQQQQPQENGNAQRPGREYSIPSPLQRLLAEMVDFFILFFIKATIIISIMHLSGIKDVSKFAMHFIVEEIDEDTSMEELQKMMLVALVYRILVCFYEIVCIWGAGGATPGKFLIGLRVVTCDSSVLVHPNRVLVLPATNVSLSASTVRALNKNFSIAFFFPAFITLLFFQHNRTVYDMVAGTIVVKRSRAR